LFLGRVISGLKRTRVQILLVYLIGMAILSAAAGLAYQMTSELYIRNTKRHLTETANQASTRVEAVLAQLDPISMLLVMDERVQSLMYRAKQGASLSVEERLSLRPIVDNVGSLSWLIAGIDLYTEHGPLYPLQNRPLEKVIGKDGLDAVRRKAGQLVWIGADPDNPSLLVAVRQVRLERANLAGGGYIVMKVSNALGDVVNTEFSSLKGSSMLLVDQKGNRIAATAPGPPDLGADILHTVKQSEELNWTIHIFVPLKAVTEELGVLKRIYECTLIVGGAVCFGLAWFLSKRITMPIRKLRKKMGGVHIALPQTNEESYFNQEINELNQAYNKLVRELHRLVETVYEKERLKNRAEIKMLQAQIHPHFLFNTLESLYWTLSEKKDRDGARLVVALSKLFRYSIRATSSEGDDWVALSEEIDHCRRFLEIMKFRLAHRLEWEIRMPEELGRVAVPKLLIQPIVENAIQHGIERSVGQGVVALDVESVPLEDGTPALRVRVRDNGPGMGYAELERLRRRLAENGGDEADGSGEGIGLANIAKRVRMHYGAGYGLRLDSAAGRGTEVQLVLPNGGASR